jgi:hypothetical protein
MLQVLIAAAYFSVAAGPAPSTLNEFGIQSGLGLLYDSHDASGFTTNAIEGEMDPFDALAQMLCDAPVRYMLVNDRTLALRRLLPGEPRYLFRLQPNRPCIPYCRPWMGRLAPLPPCIQYQSFRRYALRPPLKK